MVEEVYTTKEGRKGRLKNNETLIHSSGMEKDYKSLEDVMKLVVKKSVE